MIHRFLTWFTNRFTFNVFFGDGTYQYIMRSYLIGGEKTRFAVFLHCFRRPDMDRWLHDHPWPFTTFLFHRGYYEETFQGLKWRPRFSILFRPAEFVHRVADIAPDTWTLVVRLDKVQSWGFITHSPESNKDGWEWYGDVLKKKGVRPYGEQ